MRIPRVYLDTSVVGGYYDAEFAEITRRFFEELRLGRLRGVISDVVERELRPAPEPVQRLITGPEAYPCEIFMETAESLALADAYLRAGVVSANYADDCRHVAIAMVAQVDVLVSWNFRHIVQFDRIQKFNAVNLQSGYRLLEIRTPREMVHYDN